MKRIIALLLVIVSFTLLLTGCAFNYAKKSSQYVTVNKSEFESSLKNLNYTAPQAIGDADVQDKILATLATAAGSTALTEGVIEAPDKVTYVYYAVNGEGAQLFTSHMAKSSGVSFQLGLSDTTGLNDAIEAQLTANAYDLTDNAYDVKTTGELNRDGDVLVSISYTMTKETETEEGEKSQTVTTVSNAIVTLTPDPENQDLTGLYRKLLEANVNTTVHDEEKTNVYTDPTVAGLSFKDAKINYQILKGTPITVSYTPYTSDYTAKDAYGKDVQLKDVPLTYYVYPVSRVDVKTFDVDSLLTVIYTAEKNEDTIKELYGEDALAYAKAKAAEIAAQDTFGKANEAKTEAQAAYDEAFTDVTEDDIKDKTHEELEAAVTAAQATLDEKTAAYNAIEEEGTEKEAAKSEMDNAQIALNIAKAQHEAFEAKEALTEAQTKAEDAANALTKAQDELTAAVEKFDAEKQSKAVADYEEATRKSLQEEQTDEVIEKVYQAIYKVIGAVAVKDELPKNAVKNEYNALIDTYENTFYTGNTKDDSSVSNYKQYGGDFDKFLIAETGTSDAKAAKEAVQKQAEDNVRTTLRIFALAAAYNCKITSKEFNEKFNKVNDNSYYLTESYSGVMFTKEAARTALQFDKLMGVLAAHTVDENTGIVTFSMAGYSVEAAPEEGTETPIVDVDGE